MFKQRNVIAIDWIEGKSYAGIEQQCIEKEIRLLKRGKAKIMTLQDVIKFCEDFLGYDCTLILAAVIENVEYYCGDDNSKKLLKRLSKRMRYGLASQTSIVLYEMGFNDRVVATEIAEILDEEYVAGSRKEIVNLMKRDSNIRKKIECKLQQYPTYFFVKYIEVI